MERRKFSPAPGFEPGFSALRADALSTKPHRIQPRRRIESSQIKLQLLGSLYPVNKETGCSSINGTSTNDGPVKRKLQGRRITTVPVSDYDSDEIELDTDYDVSGVLSIFTDSESDVEKKTKSVKIMLKAHSYMVVTYKEELWPWKVLEVKNKGAVVSCI
ncbi:hypothetical protein ANN_27368 [Periplaneta americana]|uniref:Uncharacterized protein n=1 Tax=Periplaneta americana TaxID=6978 RepID=A0ABQ8RXX4_PERAM|nr:hypothetical protein ANN_27368 [Periplaneta americana]